MVRKDVAKLAFPIITEQAFIMAMGVINAIMAGHLGKEAVSAIGMVDSINNIFIAFFSALAVGGTVVVAHYAGQMSHKHANEAARHAILSGLVISLLVTVVIFIFRYGLIRVLYRSAEQQVLDYSFTYLNITLLTYPFIALFAVACGVLRGAGDTKTPAKITIIMNVLNIILSYTLIYGIKIVSPHFALGIPGFGIKGAALGIAAARIIGAALIMYTLFTGSKLIKLTFIREFRPDYELLRSIFCVGLPASVESLLFNGGKLITQVFIVGMGTAAIAANYIAGSVFGLVNIPGGALSIAATAMIGQYMGRGESQEAKETLIYLTKLSSICLMGVCAITFPFAGLITSVYTRNSDVIEIASALIKTCAIAMPLIWSVSFIVPAGLKSTGDAKYTMIVSIFGMWVFRITLGYILGVPLGLGVVGVWIGMYIDWLVRGILFAFRLRGEKWKGRAVVRSLEEPMQI